MSTTSKSPRRVLLVAHAIATRAIPAYSHPCSPRVFTQHQLFACLVLKRMMTLDDRGVVALLDDCPDLRNAIGMTRTPDHSTLHKFSKRFLRSANTRRLLNGSMRLAVEARVVNKNVRLAAIDSTGMESHHTSRYFVRRREKGQKHAENPRLQRTRYRRFPKLQLLCDTRSHMILASGFERGPGPDHHHFEKLPVQAKWRVNIHTLAADAGYDSEPNHLIARHDLGVVSLIPCKIGRPTDRKPTGYYRALMAARLHLTRYGQRWQIETVNSMIKRRQTPDLRTRTHHAERRACALVVLTHNVMILLPGEGFQRSKNVPFVATLGRLTGYDWPANSPSRGDPAFVVSCCSSAFIVSCLRENPPGGEGVQGAALYLCKIVVTPASVWDA